MTTLPTSKPAQRGAALIVSLVFLIILTLLGTTAAMNTSLQERMAGNTRNRDLAFQAAEHALAAADDWLRTQTTETLDDIFLDEAGTCSNTDPKGGYVCFDEDNPTTNDAAYWQSSFGWDEYDLLSPPESDALDDDVFYAQPVYLIERMPSYKDAAGKIYRYYRVTARGVGGSADAVVILQAMYRIAE